MSEIVVPLEVRRAIWLEAAQWLSERQFAITPVEGTTDHDVKLSIQAWWEGYQRAIFEMRSAATPTHLVIPDDISELGV